MHDMPHPHAPEGQGEEIGVVPSTGSAIRTPLVSGRNSVRRDEEA